MTDPSFREQIIRAETDLRILETLLSGQIVSVFDTLSELGYEEYTKEIDGDHEQRKTYIRDKIKKQISVIETMANSHAMERVPANLLASLPKYDDAKTPVSLLITDEKRTDVAEIILVGELIVPGYNAAKNGVILRHGREGLDEHEYTYYSRVCLGKAFNDPNDACIDYFSRNVEFSYGRDAVRLHLHIPEIEHLPKNAECPYILEKGKWEKTRLTNETLIGRLFAVRGDFLNNGAILERIASDPIYYPSSFVTNVPNMLENYDKELKNVDGKKMILYHTKGGVIDRCKVLSPDDFVGMDFDQTLAKHVEYQCFPVTGKGSEEGTELHDEVILKIKEMKKKPWPVVEHEFSDDQIICVPDRDKTGGVTRLNLKSKKYVLVPSGSDAYEEFSKKLKLEENEELFVRYADKPDKAVFMVKEFSNDTASFERRITISKREQRINPEKKAIAEFLKDSPSVHLTALVRKESMTSEMLYLLSREDSPVPGNVARGRSILAEGGKLKVVTARLGGKDGYENDELILDGARSNIEAFCRRHFVGRPCMVTNELMHGMFSLYDDRAEMDISKLNWNDPKPWLGIHVKYISEGDKAKKYIQRRIKDFGPESVAILTEVGNEEEARVLVKDWGGQVPVRSGKDQNTGSFLHPRGVKVIRGMGDCEEWSQEEEAESLQRKSQADDERVLEAASMSAGYNAELDESMDVSVHDGPSDSGRDNSGSKRRAESTEPGLSRPPLKKTHETDTKQQSSLLRGLDMRQTELKRTRRRTQDALPVSQRTRAMKLSAAMVEAGVDKGKERERKLRGVSR